MTVVLARPKLMKWNNKIVTDHNRSELSIAFEPIERKQRMFDGTLRKHIVNLKRTFSCSWEMLPATGEVVGGGLNGQGIETFYKNHYGAFELELHSGEGKIETYTVMFSEFSRSIQKRGVHDMWEVSVSMDEC